MKKIITIAILLFSMASFAQGNLQFNQVLTYTGSLNNTQQISSTYTVPVGKIWKIKFVSKLEYSVASSNNTQNLYAGFALNINNKWLFGDNFTEIFLKSGDSVKLGWTNQSNNTTYTPYNVPHGNFDFIISIVEFNIVQ
jgi:hypothetical protein